MSHKSSVFGENVLFMILKFHNIKMPALLNYHLPSLPPRIIVRWVETVKI